MEAARMCGSASTGALSRLTDPICRGPARACAHTCVAVHAAGMRCRHGNLTKCAAEWPFEVPLPPPLTRSWRELAMGSSFILVLVLFKALANRHR